jgi:uncharacterized protein (DUF983 family)
MTSPETTVWTNGDPAEALPRRPIWRSMWRGFRCRCPHCGEGRLFNRYLKPVANCAVCDEDFTHQRADDAPPYFTMVIVGHLVVPVMLAVALTTELSNATHIAIWVPVTLVLSLALLQPIKGALIALQWALRMHGFDGSKNPDAMPDAFGRDAA